MEDIYLLIGAAILEALQILCFFAKKVWIRVLPLLTIVALMVLCITMYALSGWTNWAYLILLALLFGALAVNGVLWLLYGIVRLLRNYTK